MNKWARFVVTFFMLVLCSAMAFAGNFSISNSTDAKFYDQNGKKLSETKEVMDNYIIRTNEEEVTLVGDLGSVTIGKNSLFSLGDLSSESPYFYLIDGSMEVSLNPSCEGSVYTAVMQYFLQKGTIASFVATDEEESCMVKGGMVVATNGITGNMVKLTYVVEEPKTATVEEVIEPVVEVETVEEIAPVVSLSPLYEEFDIYGQKATITAYVGEAHITVPDFVTENDINTAAAAAMAYYAPYLQGIFYSFEDGYIKVTYPESYGPQEFEFASSILKVELPAYLNLLSSQYISNSVDVVKETTTEEVVAEETIVEETIIEEVIEESATEEFDVEISEETVVE
ncbi:MAG: hypothetical protein HUK24_01230, partial [Sphaerochaetaceae bacterium]|nr:hypothetical protein [Sphaerochaetaceae bacterium]